MAKPFKCKFTYQYSFANLWIEISEGVFFLIVQPLWHKGPKEKFGVLVSLWLNHYYFFINRLTMRSWLEPQSLAQSAPGRAAI